MFGAARRVCLFKGSLVEVGPTLAGADVSQLFSVACLDWTAT